MQVTSWGLNRAGCVQSRHFMLLDFSLPLCLPDKLALWDLAHLYLCRKVSCVSRPPLCFLSWAFAVLNTPSLMWFSQCPRRQAPCLPPQYTGYASRKERSGPFCHVILGPNSCPAPMTRAQVLMLWLRSWGTGQSLPQSVLSTKEDTWVKWPRVGHFNGTVGLVNLTDEFFILMRPRWPV